MVNRSLLLLCILSLMIVSPVWSANILGIYSTFSPSHLIVHMSMMRTLADRGHNITIVSMLKPKLIEHENITVILATPTENTMKALNDFLEGSSKTKINMPKMMFNMLTKSESLLSFQYEFLLHPNLKNIYENPQIKYDLVIQGYLMNEFQLGVGAKLKVPTILSWVGVPFTFVDDSVGNIYDPTYVPSIIQAGDQTMNFKWRMRNFLTWVVFKGISLGLEYQMNKYYDLAFGNDTSLPSYNEVLKSISLLFYNYHSHSEGPVRPTVPQSVEIGGIQIKEQSDPLPKELALFLDNATEGAIFFSLGTNVKIKFLEPRIVDTLYKVLSRQKLRVIWKWENEVPKPGNASNIYFHNWLPQDDILAHPKIKLFITHAGKGGVAEAQYHGVPMLALPVFGDQPGNARTMVSAGFGLSMDLLSLTEESLEDSIKEILQNPVYRDNVRNFSALYRDRPITARQSVVFWTEYVLRHKGAYHLQSPSLRLGFIARYNLDVYAVLLFILSCSFIISILLLRVLIRRIRLRKQSKSKVKNN